MFKVVFLTIALTVSASPSVYAQAAGGGADKNKADREKVTPGSENRTTERDITDKVKPLPKGPDVREVHPPTDPIRKNTGQ